MSPFLVSLPLTRIFSNAWGVFMCFYVYVLTERQEKELLSIEEAQNITLSNGIPTKVLIKCENIKRILPQMLSMGSYQGVFGTRQNTSLLMTVMNVRMDRKQTHVTIEWTSDTLEKLFEHLFTKTRDSKEKRAEVNDIIKKMVGRADKKLNSKEGKTRSFIAQNVSFRRVPRVRFVCLLGPKNLSPEETSISDEERRELHLETFLKKS